MAFGMANICRVNYEEYLAYQGQSVIKVVNSDAEFTMRAILEKKRQGEYPCTTGLIEYN